MRQTTFGWEVRLGFFISLATIVALSPPAWAYINGGTYHSTLQVFQGKLQAEGWRACFASPLPGDPSQPDKVAVSVSIKPKDNAEFQHYVNQLVSQVVQSLPADQVPRELKHEIALLARVAIHDSVANKGQTIKQGVAGQVQYQVGAVAFESYWETNYGGRREIHRKLTRLVPFVALKIATPKN